MSECEEMVQSEGIWTNTLKNFRPNKDKGIEKITVFFISHWYEDAIERLRSIIKMANKRWGSKLGEERHCYDRNGLHVPWYSNWKNWTWELIVTHIPSNYSSVHSWKVHFDAWNRQSIWHNETTEGEWGSHSSECANYCLVGCHIM